MPKEHKDVLKFANHLYLFGLLNIYRGNAIKDKDAKKTSMDICSQAPPLSHFTQLRRDTRGMGGDTRVNTFPYLPHGGKGGGVWWTFYEVT